MIQLRRGNDRGHTQLDWLDSRHTFSFGDYYDPNIWGSVISESSTKIGSFPAPGSPRTRTAIWKSSPTCLKALLAHKDSTGTSSVIRVGDVQRMSAGTGISHSEYNASQTEPVHFLQIWIIPDETGLPPGYEQRAFPLDEQRGKWTLIAAKDGRDGSVTVHQDVDVWAARFSPGEQLNFSLKPSRNIWTQVARGAVKLNGMLLNAGDGAAISEENTLELKSLDHAEILVFDLA